MPNDTRQRGYVVRIVKGGGYGFIETPDIDERTGHKHQWHFSFKNSLAAGTKRNSLVRGSVVAFIGVECPAEGKSDKATEIEVVG